MDARSPGSAAGAGEAIGARSERLVVGLVRGVHGLHGVVRIEVLTDRPEERYATGSVLHREGSNEPLTVMASTAVADGPGWRLQFAEVPDRTAAESLMGAYLEAEAGPDAVLPRGAYYWHEVIGTPVVSTTGEALGTVRDVYRSGGAEVYTVDGGPYGEFDVPGVRDFVRIFAPRRGEIVVDVEALDLPAAGRRAARVDRGAGERPRAPRRRPGSRRGSKDAPSPSEATTVVGNPAVGTQTGGTQTGGTSARAAPADPTPAEPIATESSRTDADTSGDPA